MKFLVLVCFLIVTHTLHAQQSEVLTNQTIIDLHAAGFGDAVIKSKIQTASCTFDLSTDGLISLKKALVSDDVITAMLLRNGVSAQPSVNPTQGLASGIYFFDSSQNKYVELDPSVLANQKDGGVGEALKTSFSGLFNSKTCAVVNGQTAPIAFFTKQPMFLFLFDTTSQGLSSNALKADVKSPSEFFLVKLTVLKNTREVVTGKSNSLSSNIGIDDKLKMPFTSHKIRNGVYEVTPTDKLKPGEYCFMFATTHSSVTNKVYDFSIRKE